MLQAATLRRGARPLRPALTTPTNTPVPPTPTSSPPPPPTAAQLLAALGTAAQGAGPGTSAADEAAAAQAALAAGDGAGACGARHGFLSQVRAQTGTSSPPDTAAQLVAVVADGVPRVGGPAVGRAAPTQANGSIPVAPPGRPVVTAHWRRTGDGRLEMRWHRSGA
jgi:hypothetical protein